MKLYVNSIRTGGIERSPGFLFHTCDLRAVKNITFYSEEDEEAIEQEKQNMLREKLEEIKETKPRMYEVLKIIAKLSKQGEVYTGLIRDRIRKAGLAVSERTLDYYLNQMENHGLIKMNNKRIRGYTREISLNFPLDLIFKS